MKKIILFSIFTLFVILPLYELIQSGHANSRYRTEIHQAHSISPILKLKPIKEEDYLSVQNTKESLCSREQIKIALPFFATISPKEVESHQICHNYIVNGKQLTYINLYSWADDQYLYISSDMPPYHILMHNTETIDREKSYDLQPVIYPYQLRSSGEHMVLKYTGYEWGPEYYELVFR